MKNIKTFKQLFENSRDDKGLTIVTFGENEFDRFKEYYGENSVANWDILRSEHAFKNYAKRFGKFYMVNGIFLVQCSGESPTDVEIINGADVNNRQRRGEEMLRIMSEETGYSETLLKFALFVANKYNTFSMNSSGDFLNSDDISVEDIKKILDDNPREAFKLSSLFRKLLPSKWEALIGDARQPGDDIANLGDLGF